ncbi:glycosyltransferase family 4 protein [Nocardia terpenica]|uniref:glycosyltransferase n=1 Tax=Nocardia terpenica TaxID=455432 RepID=UPI001892FB01|nr:glycosyltransferase [Nocardia terpenica]MBF6063286.1 glycosyltransferase family 4 protein [Nocardia terpenica]MBF6105842.1 glycosyltransferase family 4 protein [Nocardia terpenica]MBF6113574.1 glycosyltransferase family 4 protein [Nocardia terpenica]MBF6119583.1 glycosyltransferase family 4 protein [Nocardia terpenica]MBF6151994.1 glycosyltransferase family 4 protein [Nocardia terpenica]
MVAHLSSAAGGNIDLPLLYSAVRSAGDVIVEPFSTRALVREHWDVIHINWPEWCIRRDRGAAVTALDAMRLLLQLRAVRLRGTKVVWTLNNLRPHESNSVVDRYVSEFSRVVDLVICSSQSLLDEFIHEYPAIRSVDSRVVRPGNYRAVYPDNGVSTVEAREKLGLPARARILLSIGMVRRYKNIVPLVRSYRELGEDTDGTSLVIAGETLDQEFARRVREECRDLDSVRLDLGYIDDASLQYYLRAADAMIASSSLAFNSASAILALSFDCPVVAPHRGTFIEMREQLGAEWVRTYDGGIRSGVLRTAFGYQRPSGRPALERYYEWSIAGREYLRAYMEISGLSRVV